MSILTGRDLEFIASLKTGWKRLYLSEVARLLKEDDPCDALPEAPSTAPPCRPWNVFTLNWAGQILENKDEAQRLAGQMLHVEAVIKMLDPTFNLRRIAVKRRKPNPWFKRGTVYRRAADVLRTATEPLTVREIAERVLAAANIEEPDKAALDDQIGTVLGVPAESSGQGR
jgi:hypothetical protein